MSAASARRLIFAVILPPLLAGNSRPAVAADGPSGGDSGAANYFTSPFLKGGVHICDGTVWPGRTEPFMMPLLAANREQFVGKKVLDIGTGSGILAVYAAQLGAAKVVATDIDPRAVACAQENARRLGFASVVETRLIGYKDPSAFSKIRPEESFDVILSVPPGMVNRLSLAASGAVRPMIPPNDTTKLALSIVDGLQKHLARDGTAVLLIGAAVLHRIVTVYARHLGYAVAHHEAIVLTEGDWLALYNALAARAAKSEGIDPSALLASPPGPPSGDHAVYVKSDWWDHAYGYLESGDGDLYGVPQLWRKDLHVVLPGMIVIRKRRTQESRDPSANGERARKAAELAPGAATAP